MIVGIDLGTTHSLIAIPNEEGGATLVPNVFGDFLTPSVVSLDCDDSVLVGQPAHDRLITHPDRSISCFKRDMGTDRKYRLDIGRIFRPEELSALILKSLKADAEHFLGQAVEEAVISVPAYFSDAQRKATRVAGELAGLRVSRLINEPSAAALAYGLHKNMDEATFLVFDLGGGTFDVSILEMFDGVMEVRATAGNNRLGGEDFLEIILRDFHEQLANQGVELSNLHLQDLSRLRALAEFSKIKLSNESAVETPVVIGNREVILAYNRPRFEEQSRRLMRLLRDPLERAIKDARLPVDELSDVVLVGGATRMPMIPTFAAHIFRRFPKSDINPDQAIALGTAIQAGLKMKHKAYRERVMTDVAPYTLGIQVCDFLTPNDVDKRVFSPIIDRNTPVPVSRTETYSTMYLGQDQVKISVYQGESRSVNKNLFLGEILMPVPKNMDEPEPIEVRFSYNVDGILEVEAKSLSSGEMRSLVVEKSPGTLSKEQIKKSLRDLEALKIHPRDQVVNRTLLSRGERMFEQCIGKDRKRVNEAISRYRAALASQDSGLIDQIRKEVIRVFDEIDAFKPI